MKKAFTLVLKCIYVFSFLMLAGAAANAQLKIGDNPTSISKSSILELESTRQGLLLPRLTDTAAINLLAPPDGMIIYLIADKSLRLRSNGTWKKIADLSDAASNWSLKGNAGTDPATEFIGTSDGQPFVMRIDASGNIGIGTNNPTAKLNVDGSVKLQNLAAGTTELDVLVLAADGSVYKRSMSSGAFDNAINAINGIKKQTLSITVDTTNTNAVAVENRSSDSTIAIHLPVQDGSSATKTYGFLTYADWQKIQNSLQILAIGAVASSSDVNGATITTSGSTRTIILHPADATNPGIVTAGTQTFGGDKAFNGKLTLNSVANNTTTDSVLVINNGVIEKRKVSSTAFGNAIRNINGNRDTAQAIAFHNSGTDLTVSTNGADSIFLNVPDAGATARGVVNTNTQILAGHKTFQDTLTAAKTMLVGNTGSANSTVQVNGSFATAIKSVSATYTLTAADFTVLANTTTSAFTVTLPNPSSFAGRMYTIKKVGTGGIDNALTISPAAGTIDGGNSYIIYNDWTFVTMQTDGTNWYIIKK
jgi:hypothetical protein